ncbi:hypothetical protein D1Z90_20215 [Motilimonas pumila]|uniref:Uncharacterized protein n=1 Tax=Motilimonas pumila TaxID=2303987 RepID=A0A418Y995_9GAMM|nr:hypothetical protein D1Z90_20215 [Motilimonas pumila]
MSDVRCAHDIEQILREIMLEFRSLESILLNLEQDWSPSESYELSYLNMPRGKVAHNIKVIRHFLGESECSPRSAQYVQEDVVSFLRNFDNPFFETKYKNQINCVVSALTSLSLRLKAYC